MSAQPEDEPARLTERELDLLTKLLGMLGAAQLGERAAAARKVDEFVRSRKADWAVLLRPQPVQQIVTVTTPAGPRTWRVVTEQLLTDHYAALYPAELEFLPSLLAYGRAPTPKQATWLVKICHRCGVPPWDGAS